MKHKIMEFDPLLKHFEKDLDYRKKCLWSGALGRVRRDFR
jgi:hypothetical protein